MQDNIEEAITNSYSTEEQVIGTWMGKPLYRKVISVNTSFSKQLEFEHGVENFERIWIDVADSYFVDANNAVLPLISTSYYTDFSQRLNAMIYNRNIILYSDGSWGTDWTKVITLKYTKTTD